jgi:hypothetical protein
MTESAFEGTAKFVRVPDRPDLVGTVIEPGKNFGGPISIRCYVVYFPSTGEVCNYDITKCIRVDEQGNTRT